MYIYIYIYIYMYIYIYIYIKASGLPFAVCVALYLVCLYLMFIVKYFKYDIALIAAHQTR